jgi:quinol monooxygenase YgiN
MTIRIVARATARPETRSRVQEALHAMLAPTRAEAGCIRYELAQSTTDPCEFAMLEEWSSEAAVAAHMRAPHTGALLATLPPLLAAPPEIRSYRLLA